MKMPDGLLDDCIAVPKARLAAIAGVMPNLKCIATELFDSVTVELDVDPEIADEQFFVFHVTASGEIPEIAARHREWRRRARELLGDNCDLVRLSIDVQ